MFNPITVGGIQEDYLRLLEEHRSDVGAETAAEAAGVAAFAAFRACMETRNIEVDDDVEDRFIALAKEVAQ
ncbi:hypothetical protein T8K17_13410 [Thalassobaculum sp. OXR-137]|uniref:hypothetical protein n=1 Tax=Thalassobaculum sp. OXR-137 TaxID=3100173 RepID=UPI002AC9D065|nr:hypothetical protein [Thalassobaculum sp. OXR-137]WPZ32240.1 hypothetical protein T8K17_13410 [Thalassobaculum sp. OXR-137]